MTQSPHLLPFSILSASVGSFPAPPSTDPTERQLILVLHEAHFFSLQKQEDSGKCETERKHTTERQHVQYPQQKYHLLSQQCWATCAPFALLPRNTRRTSPRASHLPQKISLENRAASSPESPHQSSGDPWFSCPSSPAHFNAAGAFCFSLYKRWTCRRHTQDSRQLEHLQGIEQ